MGKTLKFGLISFASGIVLNIIVRLAGPTILHQPLDSPLKVPLLVILGISLVLSILLIIVGFITGIIGAIRQSQ